MVKGIPPAAYPMSLVLVQVALLAADLLVVGAPSARTLASARRLIGAARHVAAWAPLYRHIN